MGWTASALLRIKRDRYRRRRSAGTAAGPPRFRPRPHSARRQNSIADEPWARLLADEVLHTIPRSSDYRTHEELAAARAALSPRCIDQGRGLRLAAIAVLRDGFAGAVPRSFYHQARRAVAEERAGPSRRG